MLSSSAHAYTDPDDYAVSAQATTVMLTLAARDNFHAHRIGITCAHLWLQSFSRLPRVAHWANHPGRAIISFRTQPGPRLLSAGSEMRPSNLIRRRELRKTIFRDRTGRFPSVQCLSPIPEMITAGAAIIGCDLTPPRDDLSVSPHPLAMAKLLRLHATASNLAEHTPAVLAPQRPRAVLSRH